MTKYKGDIRDAVNGLNGLVVVVSTKECSVLSNASTHPNCKQLPSTRDPRLFKGRESMQFSSKL